MASIEIYNRRIKYTIFMMVISIFKLSWDIVVSEFIFLVKIPTSEVDVRLNDV